VTTPATRPGGYIIDSSALSLLGGVGTEVSRKHISMMISRALKGVGPPIRVPAVAMLVAAIAKPHLAEHVTRLAIEAPDGAIEVDELNMFTVVSMEPVAAQDRTASIDVWHTAYEALAHRGWTLVTRQSGVYRAWRELTILELH
jgi:hypothetical protein